MKAFLYLTLFFTPFYLLSQNPPTGTYGPCNEVKNPTELTIIETEIVVGKRSSKVYDVLYDNNQPGIEKTKGACFNLVVKNKTDVPTGIHWHGLILPNLEDGVPYVTQEPIPPKGSYSYNFKIVQEGTYWAHSHYGLQEQKLMGLPLILNPPDGDRYRSIVLFFEGFTFQSIDETWQSLRKNFMSVYPEKNEGWIPELVEPKIPLSNNILNDVYFDAFLCNRKTLEDPDVHIVKPKEKVRLRIINGSASSNFHIFLDRLHGKIVAVDGKPVYPFYEEEFPIATAQRVDVIVTIPSEGGIFPIFAQCQGRELRGGSILMTEGQEIPSFSSKAPKIAPAITNQFEKKLHAVNPLPQKKVDRNLYVDLVGNMKYYVWGMNDAVWPNDKPLTVKEGERVEVLFINKTPMSHPMHLHGHDFQVMEVNGEKIPNGAKRDTVLVMPYQTLKIQFDANNPGIWPFHCHNIYHLWGGMFTTVQYEGFSGPSFPCNRIEKYSQRYGGYYPFNR